MRLEMESGWAKDVFIETGTYLGESLSIALGLLFKERHSVEFCKSLADAAKVQFAGRAAVHHGSSPVILSQIMDPAKPPNLTLGGK